MGCKIGDSERFSEAINRPAMLDTELDYELTTT